MRAYNFALELFDSINRRPSMLKIYEKKGPKGIFAIAHFSENYLSPPVRWQKFPGCIPWPQKIRSISQCTSKNKHKYSPYQLKFWFFQFKFGFFQFKFWFFQLKFLFFQLKCWCFQLKFWFSKWNFVFFNWSFGFSNWKFSN